MNETPATELEQLMQTLFELIRWDVCESFGHEGLKYKPPEHYLTNDGFPLGTIAWYIAVHANGYHPLIVARTPEECVRKTIAFFTEEIARRNRGRGDG